VARAFFALDVVVLQLGNQCPRFENDFQILDE